MTRTLDVNLLLIASDSTNPRAERAAEVLAKLSCGPEALVLFWPVLLGYLRISTHPRVFARPLDPVEARQNVSSLLEQPSVRTVGEGQGFWATLTSVCEAVPCRGNAVPDAHLVALMRQHEVRTIVTNDRDFRRYDGIRVVDPFA